MSDSSDDELYPNIEISYSNRPEWSDIKPIAQVFHITLNIQFN
jgi:hypothetical protein